MRNGTGSKDWSAGKGRIELDVAVMRFEAGMTRDA
jgi:hypothetical protein